MNKHGKIFFTIHCNKGGIAMKQEKKEEKSFVDFKDVTPEILIGEKKEHPLYVKAFLECREESISEYAQNTSTWD